MGSFWDVLKVIVTTQGVPAALLFGALVYQTWQLDKERKDRFNDIVAHNRAREEEAKERVSAFKELSTALSAINSAIALLTERIGRPYGRRVDRDY